MVAVKVGSVYMYAPGAEQAGINPAGISFKFDHSVPIGCHQHWNALDPNMETRQGPSHATYDLTTKSSSACDGKTDDLPLRIGSCLGRTVEC